jgi:SAM-dependent methyltransferase
MPVGKAYDSIAGDYDELVRGDGWMRDALLAHYLRLFRPGDRVLDVGCGTGLDAEVLARYGVRVVGVDASPAMIARFRARAARAGVAELVEGHVLDVADLRALPLEDGALAGAVSSFAGLNTVPDLSGFARDVARLLRPRGRLVVHMLNRFSLWEWLGYVSRCRWSAARTLAGRRERSFEIGGRPVPHRVSFASEAYRRYFASEFVLRHTYGLGALRPPHTVRRFPPRLVATLEWLDVRLGALPPLRDAGRFFVLDLEKR